MHPLTLREVEVVRVADLTPGMRRITLSGEQLREFTSDRAATGSRRCARC
ncbi:siderophore-interacting protein [Lentzea sp. NPDC055074]